MKNMATVSLEGIVWGMARIKSKNNTCNRVRVVKGQISKDFFFVYEK